MSESKQQDLQQETIQAERLATALGTLRSPSILLDEYKENAAFLPKIQQLCQKYTGIRPSRGDGNCFYRSVAFQVLNYYRQSANPEIIETALVQHTTVLEGLCNFFGHQKMCVEDFYDVFCESARALQGSGIEALETLFLSPETERALVYWIRLLTSFAIQSNAEAFQPFIIALGYNDANSFCKSQVEPSVVDADNLPIQALAEFMGWFTTVEYLDASSSPLNQHTFGTEKTGTDAPKILLLYRPGHYDMLVV